MNGLSNETIRKNKEQCLYNLDYLMKLAINVDYYINKIDDNLLLKSHSNLKSILITVMQALNYRLIGIN